MTDEEKKAIEEIGLIIESFYDFPNPINIDLKDRDVKFLETILNLVQKQQKEISELKEKYDKDTHTLQNQLDVANADLYECNNIISDYIDTVEEKDKIIDVIVQEYEYNAGIIVKNFCEEEMRKDKCIQDCRCCIKQYFEKKARNNYE